MDKLTRLDMLAHLDKMLQAPASHIHGVMTDAEYEQAKAEFLATYGASNAEAAALRDQALAKLFARSGWTQEKLAEKEGKSRQWVAVPT